MYTDTKNGQWCVMVPQQVESCWCLVSAEACNVAYTCEGCSSATAESQPKAMKQDHHNYNKLLWLRGRLCDRVD